MLSSILLALSVVTAVHAQEQQQEGCSVCGDGLQVGAPDGVFEFPGQPPVTCADLEIGGQNGEIPLSQCPFFSPLLDACDCQP